MALDNKVLKRVTFPNSDMQLGVTSYSVYTDTLATITAANYFVGTMLRQGDIIMADGSDNETLLIVDTCTSTPSGIATAITTKAINSNALSAFDIATSAALSSSLTAFGSAAAGTAVAITVNEYTALLALSGAAIGGSSASVLSSSNADADYGSYTLGGYSGYINMAPGKTIFAFAMNAGNVGDFQMKTGPSPTNLVNIHDNLVQSQNAVTYFVIKTPTIVSGSTNVVAGFAGSWGSGSSTSSGSYYNNTGNVLYLPSMSSNGPERRYQILGR